MSQTPRLRRARQLTASVLPTRAAGAYPTLVTERLRKAGATGSTGMLPFYGSAEGAIFFRNGRIIHAESERTPGPAIGAYQEYAGSLPPLDRIMAIRAVTEPIIDAVLELFTAQAHYARFRSSRLPDAGLASGIGVVALLAETERRQRLMKHLSVVLTPDTAIARNPHLRLESVRVSAWQWDLLIRVAPTATPRNLAWDLGRSVCGTTTDVYRLLALGLLSAAGEAPGRRRAMSFVRAASVKKGDTMPVISAGAAVEDAV